jgi:hypothetical protein
MLDPMARLCDAKSRLKPMFEFDADTMKRNWTYSSLCDFSACPFFKTRGAKRGCYMGDP